MRDHAHAIAVLATHLRRGARSKKLVTQRVGTVDRSLDCGLAQRRPPRSTNRFVSSCLTSPSFRLRSQHRIHPRPLRRSASIRASPGERLGRRSCRGRRGKTTDWRPRCREGRRRPRHPSCRRSGGCGVNQMLETDSLIPPCPTLTSKHSSEETRTLVSRTVGGLRRRGTNHPPRFGDAALTFEGGNVVLEECSRRPVV